MKRGFEDFIGETVYKYAKIKEDETILELQKENKLLKRDVEILEQQKYLEFFYCKTCSHYYTNDEENYNDGCNWCSKAINCNVCGNNLKYNELFFCSVKCIDEYKESELEFEYQNQFETKK